MLIILGMISIGAIYMQKDERGNIIYSDTSLPHSTPIVLPESNPPNSSTADKSTTTTKSETTSVTIERGKGELQNKQGTEAADAKEAPPTDLIPPPKVRENYPIFNIASPKEQDTIQNQVTIPVSIAIKPDLAQGDKIQLFLDNQPWGQPRESINLELSGVERGTHMLSAAIVDSHGIIIKQAPGITIYVHRASAATRPKPATPAPTSLLQPINSFFEFLQQLV